MFGVVSLAVLGAAFEAKGLGGDAPLEAWVKQHQDKDETLTTFSTIKLKSLHSERGREGRRSAPVNDQAATVVAGIAA